MLKGLPPGRQRNKSNILQHSKFHPERCEKQRAPELRQTSPRCEKTISAVSLILEEGWGSNAYRRPPKKRKATDPIKMGDRATRGEIQLSKKVSGSDIDL